MKKLIRYACLLICYYSCKAVNALPGVLSGDNDLGNGVLSRPIITRNAVSSATLETAKTAACVTVAKGECAAVKAVKYTKQQLIESQTR